MRKYVSVEENKLNEVICNKCGRKLTVENGCLKEGCFNADFVFGYFSKKDGTRHRFDLCESCYDKWLQELMIPVEETAETELL